MKKTYKLLKIKICFQITLIGQFYSFQMIFLSILFLVLIQQSNSLNSNISDEFLGSTGKHLFHFVHVIIVLNPL
jgi:hypothetical protein